MSRLTKEQRQQMRKELDTMVASAQARRSMIDRWGSAVEHDARAKAWCRTLSGVNSVLVGTVIPVVADSRAASTAATDGKQVLISPDVLASPGEDVYAWVANLKGLNYHELSHIVDTPHNESPWFVTEMPAIARSVGLPLLNVRRAWNVLEDQRIETRAVLRWLPTQPWFTATVVQFLLEQMTPAELVMAFPLIHGRYYLPASVRKEARRLFTEAFGAEVADEAASIIDAFLPLSYDADSAEMARLVARFVQLLLDCQAAMGGDEGMLSLGEATMQMPPQGVAVRQPTPEEIEQARKAAEAAEAGEDGEGDEGTLSGSKSDTDGDVEGEPGGDGDEPGGDGWSPTGTHLDQEAVIDDAKLTPLRTAAEEAMQQVLAQPSVKNDVMTTLRAVNALTAQIEVDELPGGSYSVATPPDHDRNQVWQVVAAIEEIRAGASPDTLRGQRRGHVNALDWARRRGEWDFNVFDYTTDDATEETTAEVVIAGDVSGSMAGAKIERMSRAMWVLKRAFDEVGIACSVVIWDTKVAVAYRHDERAAPGELRVFHPGGGTNPTPAAQWATKKLAMSDATIRQFWLLSDGEFRDYQVNESLSVLNDAGVATYYTNISRAPRGEAQDFDRSFYMSDVRQLATYVSESVEDAMYQKVWR